MKRSNLLVLSALITMSILIGFAWRTSPEARPSPSLINNGQLPSTELPIAPTEDEGTQQKRRKILTNWLDAADSVATQSQDPEATAVVAFLRKNAILAAPTNMDGIQTLESSQNDDWVAILPLIADDELKGGHWKSFFSTSESIGAAANFLPESRTIILKDSVPLHPNWKGMLLLHEGHHAHTFIREMYDWTDQQTYCTKERDTHSFQNRVALTFSERYAPILTSETSRLKATIKKDQGLIGTDFPDRGEYNTHLDAVFGEARSERERDIRQSHLWIHACFDLIDQEFKGDTENQKALFLRTIYLEGGILQNMKD